ncbi:metallophosphoesterase [bacterium]|nr:metallophosphoesterase [bacterium]
MADRLRLAIIGDLHIAVSREEADARLEIDPGRKLHSLSVELAEATVQAVNAAEDIDAAVILGDMTRDSELFNHEIALQIVRKLNVPCSIVAGNHDMLRRRPEHSRYPGVEILDRNDFCDFYRGHGLPGATTRYVVPLPGDHTLIVMDSNLSLDELRHEGFEDGSQDDGFVLADQLAWLEQVLEHCRDSGHVPIVAIHHSIMDHSPAEEPNHILSRIFRYWQVHEAGRLRELLQRYGVRLVLSGHIHAQSVNVQDGIVNLVTSAAVSYPHAWRLLHIEGGICSVESQLLGSLPSVRNLQYASREWMNEGMGGMIREKVSGVPLLAPLAGRLTEMVERSGWWPRFSDGTLGGFRVDPALVPQAGGINGMAIRQVVNVLDDYGRWKSERPDPNTLRIRLRD